MAKAIAHGLLNEKSIKLSASSPSLSNGTTAKGINTHSNNLVFLPEADVVILAVKPVMMKSVMQEIIAMIPPKALVISVAAGIPLSWFNQFNEKLAVVRAMPNIASSVGKGATPLVANPQVTLAQKKQAEFIFNATGLTTWVMEEEAMDAFNALSGSGPAYVFLFMEEMIHAACALGLEKETAKTFTMQTVAGALELAEQGNLELSVLRKHVTSQGGTTAAALEVFKQQAFGNLISLAMKAAYNRAKELGLMNTNQNT